MLFYSLEVTQLFTPPSAPGPAQLLEVLALKQEVFLVLGQLLVSENIYFDGIVFKVAKPHGPGLCCSCKLLKQE